MLNILFAIFCSLFVSTSYAKSDVNPLHPDQAFSFSTYIDQKNQLIAEWNIAPGYYLYRNKVNLTLAPTSQVQIGQIVLPQGELKKDTVHGTYQAYEHSFRVTVPLQHIKGVLNLAIAYQGCSSAGFCYSPIKKYLVVDLSQIKAPQNLSLYLQSMSTIKHKQAISAQDAATHLFDGHSLLFILLSFLGLGFLLAFTPCVLPMVPILSGIIIGHEKKTQKKKAFSLSLAYVTGMAATYALVGVVIALIGSSIQAKLQHSWIIVLFSGLFVLLALSLFGFYELRLPNRWQQRVNNWSHRQKGGTYLGVFFMGSLSTLIVSPCVSAPLVGVLAYIGQTGNVILGALALLSLGIGMGIPLLLLGISAEKLLPKAGPWMHLIERFFGFVMLGIAIWMLSRMIPGPVTLFLWSVLCVASAIFLEVFPARWKWISRSIALPILLYGIILMIGAVLGNSDPLNPWEQNHWESTTQHADKSPFTVIQTLTQLNQQLAIAQQTKRRVILDFYADWCTSCILMDKQVFSRENVQRALASFIVLRVDVTRNDEADQVLLQQFHLIGPPSILFFDPNGKELEAQRIVGEVSSTEFLTILRNLSRAN